MLNVGPWVGRTLRAREPPFSSCRRGRSAAATVGRRRFLELRSIGAGATPTPNPAMASAWLTSALKN